MNFRTAFLALFLLPLLLSSACFDDGPGSDFDSDGLLDEIEDVNDNVVPDLGEADFTRSDTDGDGVCDGLPDVPLPNCTGCEDCDNDGFFEPCLAETDPLNDDTDNDGTPDGSDGANGFPADCSNGGPQLGYGASLPPGKSAPAPVATPIS